MFWVLFVGRLSLFERYCPSVREFEDWRIRDLGGSCGYLAVLGVY